jgi:hypothetical protein
MQIGLEFIGFWVLLRPEPHSHNPTREYILRLQEAQGSFSKQPPTDLSLERLSIFSGIPLFLLRYALVKYQFDTPYTPKRRFSPAANGIFSSIP